MKWDKLITQYSGKWVALESDERTVVSSGSTAKLAYNRAIKVGYKSPIMFRVPDKIVPHIGGRAC